MPRRAQHDTVALHRQSNVKQVYLRSKCGDSILLVTVNRGCNNVLDTVISILLCWGFLPSNLGKRFVVDCPYILWHNLQLAEGGHYLVEEVCFARLHCVLAIAIEFCTHLLSIYC